MRARSFLCALGLAALGASPALHAAPAAPVAAPAAVPQGDAAKIESLQQRLLASQQTIATLERELAAAKNRAVVMDECRVKNGRLVFISRELIEAYQKRYKETRKDPLQLGRRRFEFELQALSDAVYTNRIDVPVPPPPGEKRPAESADAAKPDKKSSGSKKRGRAPADQPPADAAPAAQAGPAGDATPAANPPKPEQAH
jgi:hypothetical protein